MNLYNISRIDFDSDYSTIFGTESTTTDNNYGNGYDIQDHEPAEPVLRAIPGKIKTRRAKCGICNLYKTIKAAQDDDCICPSCLLKRELMIRQVHTAYMSRKEQRSGCDETESRLAVSY